MGQREGNWDADSRRETEKGGEGVLDQGGSSRQLGICKSVGVVHMGCALLCGWSECVHACPCAVQVEVCEVLASGSEGQCTRVAYM